MNTIIDGTLLACPRCHARLGDLSKPLPAQCPSCEARFLTKDGITSFIPIDEMDQWQEFFTNLASAPTGETPTGVAYRAESQFRLVMEGFRRVIGPVLADESALDVGCGNGLFSELFTGRPAVGIDYSFVMCQKARRHGVTAFHADAMALPFDAGQFDVVYSAETLQYIHDVPAFFTELVRVTRPGGRIAVSTLNRTSLVRAIARAMRRDKISPGATLLRNAPDLVDAARGLPLTVRGVAWIHMPLPFIHSASGAEYAAEALASNIVVAFTKIA